jgi:hypothetical protein
MDHFIDFTMDESEASTILSYNQGPVRKGVLGNAHDIFPPRVGCLWFIIAGNCIDVKHYFGSNPKEF